MKLRNRFLLIACGIVVFLIITPILIFYALGFKYDFNSHQIIKTGTLVVSTMPAKAQILLNGATNKTLSPANIRFLDPGDYQVTLQKDGYQTWTKRLNIRAQIVTWANDNREYVTLFLQTPKLTSTIDTSYLPQVITNDKEKITELLQGLKIQAPSFQTGQEIQGNNQIFLILDGTLYLVNGSLEPIYSPVTAAAYDSRTRQLLYSNGNEIYLYDPVTQNSQVILRSLTPISNPEINAEDGYIFYISGTEIKAIELDGRDQRNIFDILAIDPTFRSFDVSDDGTKITVTDTDNSKTYQIR